MKSLFLAILLIGVASCNAQTISKLKNEKDACETSLESCCKDKECDFSCSSLILENASHYTDFIKLSNDHIAKSYEYLFLASQFSTHSKDRPGFKKVLDGLSNSAWEKGIEMIKEISKRGANHVFNIMNANDVKPDGDLGEVGALAKALRIEKALLIEANDVHRHHSHASNNENKAKGYDAGLSHYLQEEVIEDKIETVRKLTGYVNDLKNLYKNEKDDCKLFPLSVYLFDQYLQK